MDNINIIVIGSGIAGLSCASTLINRGLRVRIFEATKNYGGRIKPLTGFANLKLEAGAQTIHSDQTEYLKLAKKAGAKFDQSEEVEWDFSIFNPKTQKIMRQKEFYRNHSFTAHSNIHFIDDREQIDDDTVLERIQKKGYDQDFMHFFKASYGAEYGASIDQISAKGIGIYEHLMELEDCDNEIINKVHHIDILNYHFKDAIEIIEFQKIVCAIELKDNKVVLHLNNDEQVVADKIVCTIPITQMKKIKWIPELDQNRKEQLNLVGMEQGGKFFIKLSKHINNHDQDDLIIPKFDYHIVLWDNSNEKESIIIGLVVGDGYQKVLDLGIENFSKEVIETINQQFKQKLTIIATHFEDWGKTPFIEGLYSYPKKGASPNYREIISQPIDDKIYFAGEAYHKNQYQTLHGAYETGIQIGKLV